MGERLSKILSLISSTLEGNSTKGRLRLVHYLIVLKLSSNLRAELVSLNIYFKVKTYNASSHEMVKMDLVVDG